METLPPSRFPDRPIEQAEGRWWIAKVKPRQEKQLAFDFVRSGIEYYFPMYKKMYMRPGEKTRKRVFTLPLFPGYLAFAQDTPHDIYSTGRVAGIVEVRHQKKFIGELSQIYNALESGCTVAPINIKFEVKSKVEVIGGPLRGLKGIVTEIRNKRYLILAVEGMGKAAVKVDMRKVREV